MTDSHEHNGLILRLAYDICGSWADAEDVAQTVHLRWLSAARDVTNPRAYLARMTVNASLDVIERRTYSGPVLPGPVPDAPAADAGLDQAAEVELAFGVVLQTLSPLERTVFLLHEVFDFAYPEIADMVGRNPDAVRQLAHRARRHVQQRRPRYPVHAQAVQQLSEQFLRAARDGDLQSLMDVLAPDVVLIADGGGHRAATVRPIEGALNVARFVTGLAEKHLARLTASPSQINRTPVWLLRDEHGGLDQIMWLHVSDGQIAQVLSVRDPTKLAALQHSG